MFLSSFTSAGTAAFAFASVFFNQVQVGPDVGVYITKQLVNRLSK
jgi:hypothetical protein